MRTSLGYAWAVVLLIPAVLTCGCMPGRADSTKTKTVTVLTAASLGDVVAELVTKFEHDAGVDVQLSTGASGALCAQIELGAPCDVFLSADPVLLERLVAGKRVEKDAPRTLARNQLVIAITTDHAPDADWPTALAAPSVRRIAIADPDTAPAGRYAKEALESLNLWGRLQPKLVRASDARAAAHYLALRTVAAAIIYQTDADALQGVTPVYTFDQTSHAPIEYVGAVVAPVRHQGVATRIAAHRFLGFLASPAAAPTWRRHGFVPTATEQEH